MTKNLLLEIGTEELPPSCIAEALRNLKNLLEENIAENNIEFKDIVTLATPRRIIAYAQGVSEVQTSKEKTVTGPPKKIAYDGNGKPTQAAVGFAKSLNLDVSRLIEVDTEKGAYLGYRFTEEPKKTAELLPEILRKALTSLTFSKQMNWGDYSFKFARPIRWIAALFGNEVINFNIENIYSSDKTHTSRVAGNVELVISSINSLSDYTDLLEKNASVIPDPEKRRKKILNQVKNIEEKHWKGNLKAVLDQDLIEEVVNLVEIPNVLTGTFPEEYLYIPKEILIKAIQHHQRYFAVLDKDENISTNFITIQNGTADKTGAIIKGNERVLRARLSDAKFFYEEDKKSTFDIWLEKLKGVVFYSKIGSLYDKSVRLEKICTFIKKILQEGGQIFNDQCLGEDLVKAARFCKCDLVTNFVVEFPELQGLVGKQYALEKGENKNVSDAIFEHYLPRFSGDVLPYSDAGAILSMADKMDSIAGIFLTGNIPSGSEDPFALRRKASGFILTALMKKYDIDIIKLSEFTVKLFVENFDLKDADTVKISGEIEDFVFARYKFKLEKEQKRTDILESIRSAGYSKVLDIDLRHKALLSYIESGKDMSVLADPHIRCKNIIKGRSFSEADKKYLKEASEIALYEELADMEKQITGLLSAKNFIKALDILAGFSVYVNEFFDKVLVMDKNEALRQNRINLVKRCSNLYFLYADFSKILQQG